MSLTPVTEAWQMQRPEFFRLPRPGTADQFFGFSRAFYYNGEQRGWWKLIRICDRGKNRGVTLIPYREVEAFVAKQREAQNGGSAK